MTLLIDCAACQAGNHSEHDGKTCGSIRGLIGSGRQCMCRGECESEERAAARDRQYDYVAELFSTPAPDPMPTTDDLIAAGNKLRSYVRPEVYDRHGYGGVGDEASDAIREWMDLVARFCGRPAS